MYNPFRYYRLTQGFSSAHQAYDYGMNVGTVLPACSAGRVTYGWFADAGYTATITRADGSWTRYCHGSPHGYPNAHQTAEGTPVLMLSGNSGTSTGPHLHVYDTAADGSRQPPFTTETGTAGLETTPFPDAVETAKPIGDDMPYLIRTPAHGHYTVSPGAVISHPDTTVTAGIEYRKWAQVMDVSPDDLAVWLFALGGCPKDNIPAAGHAWYAASGSAPVEIDYSRLNITPTDSKEDIAAEVIRQQKLPGN